MRETWRRWMAVLGLALAGCAAAPPPPSTSLNELYADTRFAPPTAQVDPGQIFKLSPAMHEFIRTQVLPVQNLRGSRMALYRALVDGGHAILEYDASRTRSASEAFEARAGNCLSLVVMTAALARELGMTVYFQSIPIEDIWYRSDQLLTLNGHVNLSLSPPLMDRHATRDVRVFTIDFIPIDESQRMRAQPIREEGIVAMYMNNLAAEAVERGELDNAYALARASLNADPNYLNAINTLAVVYRRHGDLDLAERSLRKLLALEPRNTQAMANLVLLLGQQGRRDEAKVVEVELRRLQPLVPFADFERGLAAARTGDWARARQAFEAELKLNPDFHELHFWLARTFYELGDRERATQHMEEAGKQAQTIELRRRYAHKLEVLRRPARLKLSSSS